MGYRNSYAASSPLTRGDRNAICRCRQIIMPSFERSSSRSSTSSRHFRNTFVVYSYSPSPPPPPPRFRTAPEGMRLRPLTSAGNGDLAAHAARIHDVHSRVATDAVGAGSFCKILIRRTLY